MKDEWVVAVKQEKLAAHGRWLARVDGVEIALFCVEGNVYAIEDSCPHGGASLCMGALQGHHLQCRAHGLKFDVRSGAMAGVSAGLAVKTFPVKIDGDEVQLKLPPM